MFLTLLIFLEEVCDEDQLQNMIENYSKHVIKQTQHQQMEQTKKDPLKTAERSTSHLQKKFWFLNYF